MNAYELADINDWSCCAHVKEVSAMLRQQADRIAELEKVSKPVAWIDYLEHSDLYDLNVSGRGIPLYTAPQIKELSDEEINLVIWESYQSIGNATLTDLCKAILKKASEK